jgi:hypothetical protein
MTHPIQALGTTLLDSARPISAVSLSPGTRVRLRNRPDDTGVVIGPGWQAGDVKVRWDFPDAMTYLAAHQLEVV